MARGIVGYAGNNPIYGEVPDPQSKNPAMSGGVPANGSGGERIWTQPGGAAPVAPGGPGGNMPDPRAAVPPVPSTPITGPAPVAPVAPPPVVDVAGQHPGNRRWREARARGMSREQFQAGGVAPQAPSSAQLNPAAPAPPQPTPQVQTQPASPPQPTPQTPASGWGGGRPMGDRLTGMPGKPNDEARMQAQRRYLGGGRPTVNRY